MKPLDALAAALEPVAPLPRSEAEPAFREPWEASVFAMTVALHQRGLFTWSEWAECLGGAIRAAQAAGDPDLGDTYYQHWLAALETMVARKGVTGAELLAQRKAAWDRAAHATPHGQPILLENDPLFAGGT
ncbi:nitrile hydratase accessory protein [Roseomonas sp. E05]|uniref:nitrile hydratase accessory protein n=1 Tax=Roseomonas sp. E05 TaxID=3046310 RepID=UPI0024BAD83D|nr:nitrile hydratase accessory protein [Roseomonas sp. E05]MDJ0388385.1 nitrile hydratase accessory protein [Roseomonas sp. E05]